MLAEKKCSSIEQYLQEGLLALLPAYDQGDKAVIYTHEDKHLETRTVSWLIKKIAACYSLDIIKLRRRCGALLNLKHHISLPINENLILLPIKVRQVAVANETTIGYISMQQVVEILPPLAGNETFWLSRILFEGGLELGTLNSVDTLQMRMHQGEMVRSDFMKWRSQGSAFKGLKRQALLDQLPNCDCLLRELFVERYGLG